MAGLQDWLIGVLEKHHGLDMDMSDALAPDEDDAANAYYATRRQRMAVIKKERGAGDERPAKRRAEKVSEADSTFVLPTEQTEPVTTLSSALIFIFGERKIGKTSLAAQFPNALVLAFETGYKGLRVYKSDIADWTSAKLALRAIKKDKSFKTIVVDTGDLAYKYAEAAACKKLGIDDPSEEEWGRGWRAVRKEFEGWLTSLTATGKGVIVLSHSHEQEVRQRGGVTYDRIMPTMAKAAREIVEGMVDVWAYYQYDGTRRVLTILGDDHIAAGHRFGERFRTPEGLRVRQIDMGESEQEAYRNFVACFSNKYTPPTPEDLAVDEEPEEETDRPVRKKKTLKKVRVK
jgi:hypothetical protein